MANDNKIEFEVVLNDGSTQKVFLKLEKQAEATAQNIQKDLNANAGKGLEDLPKVADVSFSSIRRLFTSTMGQIAIVASTAAFAVKKAFDQALEGEKLLKIEKQFQSLAAQAGVSANKIRQDFSQALNGVVDDSQAFEVLNQSLAKTNVYANKLSDLMILARKSTNLFGGDAIANFNDITSAIATGNTRQLRNLGIIIDADKAQRDYARSIGTTVEYLSQEGRQQAILNEVLKVGGDRFRNVAADAGGATEAFQRFNTSIKNLGDEFSKRVAEAFGPKFAQVFEFFSLQIDKAGASVAGTSEETTTRLGIVKREIAALESELKSLQAVVADARANPLNYDKQWELTESVGRINSIKKALKEFNAERIALQDVQERKDIAAALEADASAAAQKQKQRAVEQIKFNEDRKKALLEYNTQFRNIALQNIQTAIQEADGISIAEERKKQIKGLKLAEIAIQEQNALDQLQQSNEQKLKAGLISQREYEELRLATVAEYAEKRKLIEEGERIERETRIRESNQRITDTIRNGLINSISASMQRLGAALAKGPAAFEDFAKSILGILGDMLIGVGQEIVLASTAFKAFVDGIKSFLPESGIIAGLALIAIGGLFKSLGGNGLGVPSAGAAGGGGVTGGGTAVSGETVANQPVQAPGQQVAVNILGNVFDTKETGLRIVDILNQSFQNDGTTLVTGSV